MLLNKGQIMVIDDSKIVMDVITSVLEGAGYSVKKYFLAREALMALADGNPDLIICDILMPEMDGFEFRKALVQDQRTAYVPFLFLTGKDDLDLMIEGMSCGVLDYITKPIQPKEFLTHIARIMDNIFEARFRLLDRVLIEENLQNIEFTKIEKVFDAIRFTGRLILDADKPEPLTIWYNRGRPINAEGGPFATKGIDAYKVAKTLIGEFEISAEEVADIKAEF